MEETAIPLAESGEGRLLSRILQRQRVDISRSAEKVAREELVTPPRQLHGGSDAKNLATIVRDKSRKSGGS